MWESPKQRNHDTDKICVFYGLYYNVVCTPYGIIKVQVFCINFVSNYVQTLSSNNLTMSHLVSISNEHNNRYREEGRETCIQYDSYTDCLFLQMFYALWSLSGCNTGRLQYWCLSRKLLCKLAVCNGCARSANIFHNDKASIL